MSFEHPKKADGNKIVLILGAGFAGLNAAKALVDRHDVHIILVDRRNHHLFQPLLYQVATAGLNAADIAAPIRSQFAAADNVEVHMGTAELIDIERKVARFSQSDREFDFDYLILACGAQHSYFAHPEWEEFAPGLKSLEQAIEVRRRILSAFEQAENEMDEVKQKALLNFVVIGGGPTGVELAGAIADISRTVLIHDFKRIDPSQARVILIEGGPRLLAAFSESLSEYTRKSLTSMGVEVLTSALVKDITAEGVLAGSEFIPTKSAFWAAGVQANPIQLAQTVERDRAGRIRVNSDLSLPGYQDIFVVGDLASVEISPGKLVPGLAPAAIQEGKYAANRILSLIDAKPFAPFKYFDKGQMATIGKNRAILQTKTIQLTGYPAWLGWLFIHILYLVGFKNRITVLVQWTWSYLFSKRGARLITEKEWKLKSP
jgi:NADH dehydrogenase